MLNGVLVWKPIENVRTYRIGSTETDKKFAGTKSYTNYKIHTLVITCNKKLSLV